MRDINARAVNFCFLDGYDSMENHGRSRRSMAFRSICFLLSLVLIAGIGYYVTYREKNYHITFSYADDITAARTDGIADYLQKRMGRRSDKTINVSGTNVSLFFADNGQTYAGALIDNDHYYTVNTAASADELTEFLEALRYDRFSLT